MDNSKRREYKKKATRAFLPSIKKIRKDEDYQTLQEKVNTFKQVIKCHTNEILFIQDNGLGRNHAYQRQNESLSRYDTVCNDITAQWTSNLFDILKEIQERFRNSNDERECRDLLRPLVYGSLFYILLQNAVHKTMKDISKEILR